MKLTQNHWNLYLTSSFAVKRACFLMYLCLSDDLKKNPDSIRTWMSIEAGFMLFSQLPAVIATLNKSMSNTVLTLQDGLTLIYGREAHAKLLASVLSCLAIASAATVILSNDAEALPINFSFLSIFLSHSGIFIERLARITPNSHQGLNNLNWSFSQAITDGIYMTATALILCNSQSILTNDASVIDFTVIFGFYVLIKSLHTLLGGAMHRFSTKTWAELHGHRYHSHFLGLASECLGLLCFASYSLLQTSLTPLVICGSLLASIGTTLSGISNTNRPTVNENELITKRKGYRGITLVESGEMLKHTQVSPNGAILTNNPLFNLSLSSSTDSLSQHLSAARAQFQ